MNNNFKSYFNFILFIPIINALADITTSYFRADETSIVHPGLLRGIFLIIFIIIFSLQILKFNRINRIIFIFLIYLGTVILFSSNILISFFGGYTKWFIALMMVPVGSYFFKDINALRKLNISYIVAAFIICINLMIAQIFGIGISTYLEDSFYLGGASVGIPNSLTIIVLCSLIFFQNKLHTSNKFKGISLIIISISLIFVLLSLKRTAIFGLIIGLIVFSYYSYKKFKLFKYVVFGSLIFTLIFLFYEETFINRVGSRTTERNAIENENRYKEIFYVWDEFTNNSLSHAFFGSEMFNSKQYFGKKYFGKGRMIHGDFTSFFYGSGLIGLLLYISIYLFLLKDNFRMRKELKKNPFWQDLNALFLGLLFSTIFMSFTGAGGIGERTLIYLYLGALLGVQKRAILNLRKIKNKKYEQISITE